MEDQELIKLRNLKAKLLDRTNGLCEKLKNDEGNRRKFPSFDKLASNITKDGIITENTLHKQNKYKVCKVTRQITGIKFKNVDRKWMNDNIFKYTANLVTSVLKIFIELTIKREGEKEFEVQDITCHFVNLDHCYMLEIQSWVQDICRKKNFSLLTSAISQYSEVCKGRSTLLEQLVKKKYATWEQCVEENGGVKLFLRSPKNVYVEFQWSLKFLENSGQCEHFFNINSTPEGVDFVEKNHKLLSHFCKKRITDKKLIELWHDICNAIDLYENKTENDSDEDSTK